MEMKNLIGVARPLMSKGLEQVLHIIKGKALKTFEISNILYRDNTVKIMSRYFSSLPTALVFNHKAKYKKPTDPIEYIENEAMINNTNIIDFTWYRGTLIFLGVKTYRGLDHSWTEDWWLSCLNNKHDRAMTIEFMKKVSREIRDAADLVHDERISFVQSSHSVLTNLNRPVRTWDDVFIPDAMQQQICTSLHKFVDGVDWYREHKIPYHFGILLHGVPGTGKSSIVQAIIHEIMCDVCVISPGKLSGALEEGIFTHYRECHRHQVVIIEDVDTNVFKHDNSLKRDARLNETDPELLGRLLNYIDGLDSPDGTIWILTTNHVDKLDPALTRPGRMDLNFEVGYVSDETFAKFMRFHYNFNIGDHHVRDGLLFGDLQTKVMLGWTPEQLLAYTKGE